MVGVLAQKYVKDKKAELAKAAKQAEGLEMTKTKKTLSQQRREKIQKGESSGEINFLLKHYKCITVKDLKELLKNEADENALQISLEGSTDKINIENVLVPVVKDSKGKVIKNSTGSSLQFLCKAKLYDPVALRRNVDIAKLRHNASLAPYFEDQLKLIKDTDLREFVESYIEHQPKFKMEYPTSSTGKYHPSWQNGEGGNGRHTKNVVKILQVFERAYPNLKWDELYAAAILHDMSKYSDSSDTYTNSEHPIIEAKKFKEYLKQTIESTHPRTGMGYSHTWSFKRKIKFICHLIKWHDGRFNCNFANKEQIKHNYTKGLKRKMKYNEAYLLHLADMISSSKDLWSEYF